jgi:hypothetical protein
VVVDAAVHQAIVAGQLAQEVIKVKSRPVQEYEQATILKHINEIIKPKNINKQQS